MQRRRQRQQQTQKLVLKLVVAGPETRLWSPIEVACSSSGTRPTIAVSGKISLRFHRPSGALRILHDAARGTNMTSKNIDLDGFEFRVREFSALGSSTVVFRRESLPLLCAAETVGPFRVIETASFSAGANGSILIQSSGRGDLVFEQLKTLTAGQDSTIQCQCSCTAVRAKIDDRLRALHRGAGTRGVAVLSRLDHLGEWDPDCETVLAADCAIEGEPAVPKPFPREDALTRKRLEFFRLRHHLPPPPPPPQVEDTSLEEVIEQRAVESISSDGDAAPYADGEEPGQESERDLIDRWERSLLPVWDPQYVELSSEEEAVARELFGVADEAAFARDEGELEAMTQLAAQNSTRAAEEAREQQVAARRQQLERWEAENAGGSSSSVKRPKRSEGEAQTPAAKDCTICLESLGSSRGIYLPCLHATFHLACAQEWYVAGGNCPVCKTAVERVREAFV